MKTLRFNYPFISPAIIPWWVEIHTQFPTCTYYFGPFDTEKQAKVSQLGYMEDLIQEDAEIIFCQVKQFQPSAFTVVETSDQKAISGVKLT
jgi:hypothetical protein